MDAAPLVGESLPAAAAVDSTTTPGAEQTSASKNPLAAIPTDSVDKVPVAREPAPRRLRASDRIKIIGLLSNAQLALDEGRLMSPSSDNAYDRYRRVLALDPANGKAKSGLRSVANRYLTLANRAIDSGEAQKANEYLSKARKADASAPNLATTQARLR